MTAGRTADIDISVVVPTYKGSASLPELVGRIEAFFAERDLAAMHHVYPSYSEGLKAAAEQALA